MIIRHCSKKLLMWDPGGYYRMWSFFGWSVINDQFFTLLMVNNFYIPYFESKYCYKLSNKDICMLFNILKQLKLLEIEGHIYIFFKSYFLRLFFSKYKGDNFLKIQHRGDNSTVFDRSRRIEHNEQT